MAPLMNTPVKFLLGSVLLAAGLIAALIWNPGARQRRPGSVSRDSEPTQSPVLLMYCAAVMKRPIEEIARRYESETGTRVELQFGGSGTLLSNLKVSRQGDLYLPADASYTELARGEDLVAESFPILSIMPVIAVARGNPRRVKSLEDLAAPGVRPALANPEAASIGRTGRRMLEARGLWERVETAIRERGAMKPTVNDVANDIKLGVADAAIVWDATVAQYPELEAVEIEGAEADLSRVDVAPLRFSKQPEAALDFARYLAAEDQGGAVFREFKFKRASGR